ncbi:hypothetical protein OESDEN_04361 [Oesophagostomum dentatum]|uniref:Uncharacterized protein n=1 Tax=Oesophagostomum dentatum TaxID=61180 RepID=A0A0B1TDT7_OESDE|nr:hypothetical protein OESDEN_04361 [Oesophagostomum dentatum]
MANVNARIKDSLSSEKNAFTTPPSETVICDAKEFPTWPKTILQLLEKAAQENSRYTAQNREYIENSLELDRFSIKFTDEADVEPIISGTVEALNLTSSYVHVANALSDVTVEVMDEDSAAVAARKLKRLNAQQINNTYFAVDTEKNMVSVSDNGKAYPIGDTIVYVAK